MEALKARDIKGVWTTLLLSFNTDGSIDYGRLAEQVDYYINVGVDGIYSNGTATEFYNQTEEEYKKISELLAKKCNASNMPFQIGCSYMSPIISLERVKYAKQLQPSAIQVILPDWFPPNRQTQISFLKRIAETADDIGIILYNPPHAKVLLHPQDFEYIISEVPQIIGIKTAAGDDVWYKKMQHLLEKISVFIPGHFLASGIKKGASGSYSNVATINPLATKKWYELCLSDMDKALEIEQRILLFFDKYITPYITEKQYPNHACDKFLASIGNWCGYMNDLRWPYIGIPKEDVEIIRKECRKIIPEFFIFN